MAIGRLLSNKEVIDLFGEFEYKDKSNGSISIDRSWLEKNIIFFKIPLLGKVRCHQLIKYQLTKIFSKIEKAGLTNFIDIRDTVKRGGCFFPRHINWDINMPLSRHSWGIAIDINPSTNLFGTKGTIHSDIIEIFKKDGFIWGGWWNIPDPMHFEVAQLL